jgi:hypothetical protein
MEPSLLYLIGDPVDPVEVWTKLENQFQKKTWANKLELRRKLYSLRLKDGESVHAHIKALTELFEALAVIGDPVTEEDKVVHLLASLPDSFDMLVTALEANSDTVPSLDNVTERLLHEERKMKEKGTGHGDHDRKAFTAGHGKRGSFSKKQLKCHFCKKPGHFRRDCRKYAAQLQTNEKPGKRKHVASNAATKESSSSDDEVMLVSHAFSAMSRGKWIVDSGATCHMCNDKEQFGELNRLRRPQEVSLGDGHVLEATGTGTVTLEMLLPDGSSQRCKLKDVLYVPKLSYSLLSVSKASEAGKATKFSKSECEILNENHRVIAFATRVGSLYFLELCRNPQVNVVEKDNKERLWHRRFGHLGEKNLRKLAKTGLVERFDYNVNNDIGFCALKGNIIAVLFRRAAVKPRNHSSWFTLMCVGK